MLSAVEVLGDGTKTLSMGLQTPWKFVIRNLVSRNQPQFSKISYEYNLQQCPIFCISIKCWYMMTKYILRILLQLLKG